VDLIDQLEALAERARQTSASLTNEEATKMALIAPFIQSLGYDIFNPTEVKPEFSADLPGVKQGERVDYAVLENGIPKILIEAKPFNTDLKSSEKGQLSRYFQATHARIGILTNGQKFLFFSDLDNQNLMDEKPFAEVDLFDLKAAPLEQIKQLSKSMFDLETLLSTAERLKYMRGVKEEMRSEFKDPSDWLVREMARRVHTAERISGQLIENFKPIVADAVKGIINDRINERLSSAMESEKIASQESTEKLSTEPGEDSEGLEFTEEEREGLYIIRAICSDTLEPMRLTEKDTKNYCNVLVDNNTWKSVCRMHFNTPNKRIEIFDNEEPKMIKLEAISEIYQYRERLKKALAEKI
jgi:predicted type IV restriction endonuclease